MSNVEITMNKILDGEDIRRAISEGIEEGTSEVQAETTVETPVTPAEGGEAASVEGAETSAE